MAIVRVPALMRDLTGGREQVEAPGHTVGEVIDGLQAAYPGAKARLAPDGTLSPALSIFVDGKLAYLRLQQPVQADSQIRFVPAVAGG